MRILSPPAGANGIYRSSDTGATWTKVSNAAIDGLMASGTVSNIMIRVGEKGAGWLPNVFVGICNGGTLAGLFESQDGGGTWTAMDTPPSIHPGTQCGIHFSMAPDPTNDRLVYVGGDRQDSPFPQRCGRVQFHGTDVWR